MYNHEKYECDRLRLLVTRAMLQHGVASRIHKAGLFENNQKRRPRASEWVSKKEQLYRMKEMVVERLGGFRREQWINGT